MTEYTSMCFYQKGDISTLKCSSLKLVDEFTCLGSSVSSTKTDINMWLTKAWTAINRLWTREKGGEEGSGIAMLVAWHDGDDDDDKLNQITYAYLGVWEQVYKFQCK